MLRCSFLTNDKRTILKIELPKIVFVLIFIKKDLKT